MIGMRLSKLTPELMEEVLDLYCRVCELPDYSALRHREKNGWNGTYHCAMIEKDLRNSNAAEWRYGSGLRGEDGYPDRHAKLFVWQGAPLSHEGSGTDKAIRFAFDPNIVQGEDAEKMKNDFRVAIEELLKQRGVAIELK